MPTALWAAFITIWVAQFLTLILVVLVWLDGRRS